MKHKKNIGTIIPNVIMFLALLIAIHGKSEQVAVTSDWSQVPELREWCESAANEIKEWYPRICNLLPSEGFTPPGKVTFKINNSEKGVGGTAGTTIGVSSGWIKKHPDDVGLVIHELTHVVQRYPKPQPWWITEGIADYIRWAIYEGKPQSWFPKNKKPEGYKDGYRVTAGFFLWLESDKAPGIIKDLNSAMRKQTYNNDIFVRRTGKSVKELWDLYSEIH